MVESELDEKVLIEAAQQDPRRFADLYGLHFDRVYAYIARRVATRADAQDVTAEVFQQALANLGRFEWRGGRGGKNTRAPSDAPRSIAQSASCPRTSGASSKCGLARKGASPRSPGCSGEAREP